VGSSVELQNVTSFRRTVRFEKFRYGGQVEIIFGVLLDNS